MPAEGATEGGHGSLDVHIRTFLIADVRGYTLFTQERGDEIAGKLAKRFAEIVRELVETRGGTLLELRGDEALCVFGSARQAIRAGVELQDRFVEETLADPALPLTVGIGLDAGEAVAVEGGYRGGALNLAARLCGEARAGEVLASREVVHLARRVEGIRYEERGALSLKGLAEPVHVVRVLGEGVDAMERLAPYAPARAPAPRQRRRRPWPVLIAAALALVLIAVAIPLLRSGPDVRLGSNSVARISPDGPRVDLATPIGERLGASAIGFGSLWVAEPDRARLVRVNLTDGEVTQTIEVGGSPSAVAVGGGSVWTTNAEDGTISRIDPDTNQVSQDLPAGSRPTGIGFGHGALWVADNVGARLLRIDPATGRTRSLGLAGQPSGVAVADDAVWVTMSPGALVQVEPNGLNVTLSQSVGSGPGGVLHAFGSVWVANRLDGTLSRVDPATGEELSKLPVGDGPDAIAAADGLLWVATEYDGTVSAIDPSTTRIVDRIRVGAAPASITTDGRDLWIAAGASPTEHLGGTLRVGTTAGLATSIDPAVVYSSTEWQILAHTNDGLLGFERVGGPEGTTLVPDLASAFPQVSPDGLTYRFVVREGIRYSNGEPLRPVDFRHGMERSLALSLDAQSLYAALDPTSTCATEPRRCDLSDVIVTDDRSVTYHLQQPDADLPLKLALPFAYPMPASVPFEDQKLAGVPSTGPYRVASASKDAIVLERNLGFRQWSGAAQPSGYVDRISWSFGQDPGDVFDLVTSGELDWITDPPPSNGLDALRAAHPSQVVSAPQASTLFIGFDLTMPPFDDVRVRQAVNFAIDRGHVVDLLGGPTMQRPTCQINPPNFAGYERICPYTLSPRRDVWSAPDVTRARRLIGAAGAAGSPVVAWTTPEGGGTPPGTPDVMRYVVGILNDLGLRATLKTRNANRYFGAIYAPPPGPPDRPAVYLSGWASDYPGGSDFIDAQFSCGAGGNASAFCDREFDRRIDQAKQLQTTDPGAANRAWAAIEHDLVDHAVWAAITNPISTYAFSERVGNVQVHPQWGVLLSRMWVR